MDPEHPRAKLSPAAILLLLACTWFGPARAAAEHQHIVRPGQSLEVIAKRYKRSAAELAAANGLKQDVELHGGQVLTVPPEGVVYVTSGQTLSQIAHEHHLGYLELAKVNHLEPTAVLRVGQRLVLPGYQSLKKETPAQKRWGKPKQRGLVTLYRIWSKETATLRLVDTKGRVQLTSRLRMREFLRPRESKKRKTPAARLLALLSQVSDHFGGRPIHVVSGYRLPGGLTRDTSRHVAGEAIDFRIPGVPLEELRDYCSRFDNVGVGFYPRTQFVHLDVRSRPARWTDWSLPGQPAVLQKPADLDEKPADGSPETEAQRRMNDIPEPEEVLPAPPEPESTNKPTAAAAPPAAVP